MRSSPAGMGALLVLLGCTPARTSTGPIEAPEPDVRYAEEATADNDPFFGGAPAETSVRLAAEQIAAFAGALDPADGNETWADSDGYAFALTEGTEVQAELTHEGGGTWAVAIHHEDRRIAAWWGMSTTGRALTHPVELPAGEYFVHVASEAPGTGVADYELRVRTGALGGCDSEARAGHLEGADDNDLAGVRWAAFPTLVGGAGAAEPTGWTLAPGAVEVLEGESAAVATTDDSYLDRDAFAIETGPDTRELRVRLSHASADVNLDALLLSADGAELIGTGVEIGDTPELAAFPVEPSTRYVLWVGARDERAIGGDTALPLAYRAVVCAMGGAS